METKVEKVPISPDWTQMPKDMLEKFCQHLSFEEQARFSSVCKAWYASTTDKANIWVPNTPWLITNEDMTPRYSLYSPTLKSFTIDKPFKSIKGYFIAGSYKGWLVIKSEDRIFILNIFSKIKIELPHRSAMPDLLKSKGTPVFTISTCGNLNPIIVACVTYAGEIAWCKIRDEAWKGHRGDVLYGNVTFYNDNLYAIDRLGNRIDIYRVDEESSLLILLDTIHATIPTTVDPSIMDVYLVESNGSLLVLRRYYECRGLFLWPTMGFEVFKVKEENCRSPHLIKVESLEDQALFISNLSCESLPAKNCSGFEKAYIYFIGHCLGGHGYELGAFSVAEGIKFRIPLSRYIRKYSPIWILPRHAFECDCECHDSTVWKPNTAMWKPKTNRRKIFSKPQRFIRV
ncbi:F-box-like domain superfamily [Sesbania bispinosa]|nr:F-box-like domain superfamily [Sesbania bispinosa]